MTSEHITGVPCLAVRDLNAATDYYTGTLGFAEVTRLGGAESGFALLRRDGAPLLLQVDRGQPEVHRSSGPPWDAVLLVGDVAAIHRDLTERGALGLGAVHDRGIGWPSFDVPDGQGNVLCFGHAVERFTRPPTEPARPSPAIRALDDVRRWRARRQERRHLAAFREFYRSMPNRTDPYYMFFTSDLLHWVVRAESFVPAEVNLVLIGSALTGDERRWIAANIDRPFHHVDLAIDDVTAWEYLFATNEHDFGWLDIDCFVLNDGLFQEMSDVDGSTSMNCTWTWDSGFGFPIAATHFVFVAIDAVGAVGAATGAPTGPGAYDWHGGQRPYRPRACFMSIPTPRQQELLLDVAPPDELGRPRFPEGDYYNTTVLFQLLARSQRRCVRPVRDLARRCTAPTDAGSTDPGHWPEDLSDELFHLFGVSYYRTHRFEPGIRGLYLAAEYAMLDDTVDRLPAQYQHRRTVLAGELAAAGVDPASARDRFRRHLIEGRHLDPPTADRILRPGRRTG